MTDCCPAWPAIRPHLGWFRYADAEPTEQPTRFAPVIGSPVARSIRVNYCPSCGALVRDVVWAPDQQD